MGTPLRVAVALGLLVLIACGVTGTLGPEGLLGLAVVVLVVVGSVLLVSVIRRL